MEGCSGWFATAPRCGDLSNPVTATTGYYLTTASTGAYSAKDATGAYPASAATGYNPATAATVIKYIATYDNITGYPSAAYETTTSGSDSLSSVDEIFSQLDSGGNNEITWDELKAVLDAKRDKYQ